MKNFKLLLATTAILSAGLAANVWADASSVNATLEASVGIARPMSFIGGSIDFGDITTSGRDGNTQIKVVVKPDGTLDSSTNAQVLRNPVVTPMYLSGGGIGNAAEAQELKGLLQTGIEEIITEYGSNPASYEPSVSDAYTSYMDLLDVLTSALDGTASGLTIGVNSLVLSNPTFDLIDNGQTDENHPNGVSCGTVSGLVPTWKITNNTGKEMEIRFGGTFTLDSNYNPSDDSVCLCSGSTTVTFIYNN